MRHDRTAAPRSSRTPHDIAAVNSPSILPRTVGGAYITLSRTWCISRYWRSEPVAPSPIDLAALCLYLSSVWSAVRWESSLDSPKALGPAHVYPNRRYASSSCRHLQSIHAARRARGLGWIPQVLATGPIHTAYHGRPSSPARSEPAIPLSFGATIRYLRLPGFTRHQQHS